MTLALIIVFFLVALVHLYCCYFKIEIPRKATKPLLLIFLLALYVTLAGELNYLVIAALILGLIGDVFLLSPKKPVFFMVGACAFALGHMGYIAALYLGTPLRSLPEPLWWWTLAAAAPYAVFMAIVMRKLVPHLPKDKKVLLPAYLVLICCFSILTLMGMLFLRKNCFVPLFLGTLLFIVSDTILSFDTFKAEGKHGNFAIMLTYIGAQAMLTLGFILSSAS